jgi:hypothetical protein
MSKAILLAHKFMAQLRVVYQLKILKMGNLDAWKNPVMELGWSICLKIPTILTTTRSQKIRQKIMEAELQEKC